MIFAAKMGLKRFKMEGWRGVLTLYSLFTFSSSPEHRNIKRSGHRIYNAQKVRAQELVCQTCIRYIEYGWTSSSIRILLKRTGTRE